MYVNETLCGNVHCNDSSLLVMNIDDWTVENNVENCMCSVNRTFMKLYDNQGSCSHILSICRMGEHSVNSGSSTHQEKPPRLTLSILGNADIYTST